MSEKQSRNEIKGIDPKSDGDFDKFMDRVRKVSKYIFPVAGGIFTAGIFTGCTPEMINAIVTTPTPEVSPLPSDFTKTPTPSPTEAPVKLTPTKMATEMPTPTEMIQTIDMTKLYHMPDSWEDMLANPENNVVAPFNPRTQPEEFMKWYDEVYVPALGDLKKLEVNALVDMGSVDYNMIGFYNQKNHPFGGEMPTFIIEDGEMKYLVVVVTLRDAKDVNDISSVAVITTDFLGNDGAKTIDVIREGKRKFSCVVISTQPVDSDSWPDNVNEMIKLGLDGRDPSTGGVRIGFGAINFFSDEILSFEDKTVILLP